MTRATELESRGNVSTLFTGCAQIYKGVFESLPEEKQSELIVRKAVFAKTAEIYL